MHFSKFFSFVTLLMVTMGVASAQQSQGNSVTVTSDDDDTPYELASQFSRFEIGESAMLLTDHSGCDFGIRAEILHAWRLNNAKAPFYFHLGIELNYNSSTEIDNSDGDKRKSEENFLNFAIPANLSLNIPLSRRCCLELLTGLNFRLNVVGTFKVDSNKINFLNEDYANHYQTGANFGVGVNFRRSSILYRFTKDFNDYFKSDLVNDYGDYLGSNRLMYHSISWGMTF